MTPPIVTRSRLHAVGYRLAFDKYLGERVMILAGPDPTRGH
jgi:hypothetical protein